MEIIAWEKLSDYIGKQLPAVIPISGSRRLALVVGIAGRSLSLRIPLRDEVPTLVSPYREVLYGVASVDGSRVLELTTSTVDLFHGFYLFAALVAEHIEERGDDLGNAIRRAEYVFGQLLLRRSLLSEEREVGLVGELCLLAAILKGWGKSGLDAWTGPAGERHDFRFGETEIEVKSTTSASRKHRINGIGQLEASPGRHLFLLSLQFEMAGMGAGQTLPGRVEAVAKLLGNDVALVTRFRRYLGDVGYQGADAALYANRYQLRSRPVLVAVGDSCPKITAAELNKAIPEEMLPRFGEITYEVDFGGLGHSEESEAFRAALRNVAVME